MEERERTLVEDRIRELCGLGDYRQAATIGLRSYGNEIYSYLVAVTRAGSDADEAYARFGLAMWEGLPGFRWECTFRTWAYTLARSALSAAGRAAGGGRAVPLSQVPEVMDVAQQVRSDTLEYLRTEVKDRVARLRDELDPEDRTLLILRVDRKLGWRDIAHVLDGGAGSPAALERRAAALRKRFERVKDTLRKLLGRDEPSGGAGR